MAEGGHQGTGSLASPPTLHDELSAANADVEAALRQERAQQRLRELNAITAGIRGGVLKAYAAQLVQFLLLVAFLAGSAALAFGLKAAGLGWAGALAIVCGVDFGSAALVLVALFVRRRPVEGTQLPGFLRSGAPLAPQLLDKLLRALASAQNQPADGGMHGDGG